MSYAFSGSEFGQEKALMMGEIYNKGGWRIAAVGQGFNGGLDALLKHFGGEVLEEQAAAPLPATPPPEPPKVRLSKVTLEKRGQSQKVSLTKGGGGRDIIHINLNWDAGKKNWWGGGEDADLDLGCMFELANRNKGVIQPLGGYFGDQLDAPYILLDKDDRSGAAADGENMRIYRPELIRRVLIFAMIYEGAANFTTVNGRVTIKDLEGNEILIRCDAPDTQHTFCAVCMITMTGDSVQITKEERYFKNASECDSHYNFGFQWRRGSK
jgi:tellurite resistance protein TerA